MKKLHLILILLSITNLQAQQKQSPKEEGIQYIKLLGKTLKTKLNFYLKVDKSGVKALEFCSHEAFKITKKLNLKLPKYAKIRRTSIHLRNEKNRADCPDVGIMENYQESKSREIIVIKQRKTTRVYKPLYMNGICLKCHGENISKELKNILAKKYPNDKAINFKAGSLRGVIVAEIKEH